MTIPAVPHETDTLVDRRRLRRRLTFWRVMAVLLAAVAVVAFVAARGAALPAATDAIPIAVPLNARVSAPAATIRARAIAMSPFPCRTRPPPCGLLWTLGKPHQQWHPQDYSSARPWTPCDPGRRAS